MSKAVRLVALALLVPLGLEAQVGHDPARSPVRAISARTSLSLVGGYLAGSGGKLGIGPADGWIAGLRYEMRLTGPTNASLTLARGQFDRMVPDPAAPADSQRTGPVRQTVIFVEGGLKILLTGDKTWNRLAPYLGRHARPGVRLPGRGGLVGLSLQRQVHHRTLAGCAGLPRGRTDGAARGTPALLAPALSRQLLLAAHSGTGRPAPAQSQHAGGY
jgi:hypothetical protein